MKPSPALTSLPASRDPVASGSVLFEGGLHFTIPPVELCAHNIPRQGHVARVSEILCLKWVKGRIPCFLLLVAQMIMGTYDHKNRKFEPHSRLLQKTRLASVPRKSGSSIRLNSVDGCSGTVCLNGGTCSMVSGTAACYCADPFFGPTCSTSRQCTDQQKFSHLKLVHRMPFGAEFGFMC
ncbi:unnamed protein product [Protopolystoma xenopodis]|uniref:EGF-like domain-containing protein n=1 Tax=Protopolystoma xenopodis TaxID=117903 RepID=A0A448WFY4_9PLAT|nr:unnamed protein product [Protopolystoma xenopodis]